MPDTNISLDALRMALGGQQRPEVDFPAAADPTLSLLQGLIQTSPVFEPGRRVGGLGQIGQALAPAAASVAAAPILREQAEAQRQEAALEALKEGLNVRKLQLEIGDMEGAAETEAQLQGLLRGVAGGAELPQGSELNVKGKRSDLKLKGKPFPKAPSEVANAIAGLSAGLGRLISTMRVDENGQLTFQTTPARQTTLQSQLDTVSDVKNLTGLLRDELRKDSTSVGFSASLQRVGFGALSQVKALSDVAKRNAISVVGVQGLAEDVSEAFLEPLFNPQAEAADALQTALVVSVAGILNTSNERLTNLRLQQARQIIGTGPLQSSTALLKRLDVIESLADQQEKRAKRQLQPNAPTDVSGAFASPQAAPLRDPRARVSQLERALPATLAGSARDEVIASMLLSEGFSPDEIMGLFEE